VSQTAQSTDQGSAYSVHVDPIEVVRTEFPVVFLTLQHVWPKRLHKRYATSSPFSPFDLWL
jgi:hypothetical protein